MRQEIIPVRYAFALLLCHISRTVKEWCPVLCGGCQLLYTFCTYYLLDILEGKICIFNGGKSETMLAILIADRPTDTLYVDIWTKFCCIISRLIFPLWNFSPLLLIAMLPRTSTVFILLIYLWCFVYKTETWSYHDHPLYHVILHWYESAFKGGTYTDCCIFPLLSFPSLA